MSAAADPGQTGLLDLTGRPAAASGTAWEFADAERRTVTVDGVEISYRVWDEAPADAPSLLFLHGFRAHSRWWDHVLPHFLSGYRVATMDISGMGDSGWRDHYTMRGFAREVLAVIAAAGLVRPTVIAHSFGAGPAACASVLDPAAIERVIMVDSRILMRGVPDPTAQQVEWVGGPSRLYRDFDEACGRFRLMPPCGEVDDAIHDHVARHSSRPTTGGWTWKFDPAFDPSLPGDPQPLEPDDITVPLDFIYGEDSAVITPHLAGIIRSLLPTCRPFIAIPACDHHVLLERPVALIAVLRTLLRPLTAVPAERQGAEHGGQAR